MLDGTEVHELPDGRIAIAGEDGVPVIAVPAELLCGAKIQAAARADERLRIAVQIASSRMTADDMRRRLRALVEENGGMSNGCLTREGAKLHQFGMALLAEVAYDVAQRPRCAACDKKLTSWYAGSDGVRYHEHCLPAEVEKT